MIKNKLIILVFFVILFIGFLIGIQFADWKLLKVDCAQSIEKYFLSVRLIEIVQLAVTLFIAFFISYIINKKINDDLKKKEIINDILTKIHDNISEIGKTGNDYMDKPSILKGKEILKIFRISSNYLGIIKDLRKEHKIEHFENLKDSFFSLKSALTDTPFGVSPIEKVKYSEDKKNKFHESYNFVLTELYKCKLELYS